MRTGKQRLRVACRTISRGLLLVCIAFAGCGPLRAQSSNAQISGVVTDPSGSAVPGAEVTAVNGATGVPYATQTNGAGVYVLSQLAARNVCDHRKQERFRQGGSLRPGGEDR